MSAPRLALPDAFWQDLDRYDRRPCLVEGATGRRLSYGGLAEAADRLVRDVYRRDTKGLAFIEGRSTIGTVVHLVAALAAGHAAHLYPPNLDQRRLEELQRAYKPEFVLTAGVTGGDEWGFAVQSTYSDEVIDPDLSLIFSTSGSTGSSKMVRLSRVGLISSAHQIIEALRIDGTSCALLNLPLSYIYGFSVLNSQLTAGGCINLDGRSFMDPRLWKDLVVNPVDELHGVPASYDLIQRAWQNGLELPTLKCVTQSGGALAQQSIDWMRRTWIPRGVNIYKMYGITEAGSRVSVLPPERFEDKYQSVGLAVPGGRLRISREMDVLYDGPNVMMGYAFDRADLGLGDELAGRLMTGDRGYLDEEGFLHLQGRVDRTVKVNGLRINLDEAERIFGRVNVAVVATDGGLKVVCTQEGEEDLRKHVRAVMLSIGVPANLVELRVVQDLPRLGNGKVDYGALTRL